MTMQVPQIHKLFYPAYSGAVVEAASYRHDAFANNHLMNVGLEESR